MSRGSLDRRGRDTHGVGRAARVGAVLDGAGTLAAFLAEAEEHGEGKGDRHDGERDAGADEAGRQRRDVVLTIGRRRAAARAELGGRRHVAPAVLGVAAGRAPILERG